MDDDAVIGKLYKAAIKLEEDKRNLIEIITAIKLQAIALDRIEVDGNSVTIKAE